MPPLRRNTYTVSRGLWLLVLLAPAQKAHAQHPQTEETQRRGFGRDQGPNRVIAAQADDVAGSHSTADAPFWVKLLSVRTSCAGNSGFPLASRVKKLVSSWLAQTPPAAKLTLW